MGYTYRADLRRSVPWKETSPMEQRLEFALRWAKQETSMAELCRAFEISRQTGYELVAQYLAEGLDAFGLDWTDERTTPVR